MKFLKYIAPLVLLFFQGCVTSSPSAINLIQQNNQVEFQVSSCVTKLPIMPIGQTRSFGKIDIERVFYQDNLGNILIHEKGRLDNNFVFSVGLNSLIYAGFELKNYKTYDIGAFHSYLEGESRNKTPIYIIAGGIGVFESFEVFYSDDENIIKKLASCIKTGDNSGLNSADPFLNSIGKNYGSFVRSEWGPSIFFKHSIIMSKRNNGYWEN